MANDPAETGGSLDTVQLTSHRNKDGFRQWGFGTHKNRSRNRERRPQVSRNRPT